MVTPKGLLRLKEASSTLADLTGGGFQPVLDDATADKAAVRAARALLRQGLLRPRRPRGAPAAAQVAVARIEQLYPFPTESAAALVASYPQLDEVVWAQEEPQNMGPWRSIRHRLEEAAGGVPLRYIGRPWRASPSEGYPTAHGIEQDRIARDGADGLGTPNAGGGSSAASIACFASARPVHPGLLDHPAALARRQAPPDIPDE